MTLYDIISVIEINFSCSICDKINVRLYILFHKN